MTYQKPTRAAWWRKTALATCLITACATESDPSGDAQARARAIDGGPQAEADSSAHEVRADAHGPLEDAQIDSEMNVPEAGLVAPVADSSAHQVKTDPHGPLKDAQIDSEMNVPEAGLVAPGPDVHSTAGADAGAPPEDASASSPAQGDGGALATRPEDGCPVEFVGLDGEPCAFDRDVVCEYGWCLFDWRAELACVEGHWELRQSGCF